MCFLEEYWRVAICDLSKQNLLQQQILVVSLVRLMGA